MLKSLEKKNNKKSFLKLLFLLFLIILPLVFSFGIKKEEVSQVLGEKERQKSKLNLNEIKEKVEKRARTSFNQFIKNGEETLITFGDNLEETTSKSAQNLTNFVLDQAISKIIEEIDKLPTNQQKQIKEKICY